MNSNEFVNWLKGFVDACPMKTDREFVNTLEDNVRMEEGCHDQADQ